MTGWIGISIGDVTGVGPEVALKAVATLIPAEAATRYLLLGDPGVLARANSSLSLGLSIAEYTGPLTLGRIACWSGLGPMKEGLEPGSPLAAAAAVHWLREGGERCLRHELDALVTAPVSKSSIIRSGIPFIGQTEFLSQLAGTTRTSMMLLGEDGRGNWLRVVLVTTHLPLRNVADAIDQPKVMQAIEMSALACRQLGLAQARIAVCGLNPHAGEGGELGDEEITTIGPAVQKAMEAGFNVKGPLSADTLFHDAYQGKYDVVVAMYHDQGLGPMKLIGFETGVNWTVGLPFVRTSPDHGTAYDIAGKGVASPSSMISAIKLAQQLARNSAH